MVCLRIAKKLGLMVALAVLVWPGAGNLYAGITVQPDSTELVVDQGVATAGSWQVSNDGKEPIHVKVESEDWLKWRTKNAGIPVEDWLKVSAKEFDLGPAENKEVAYTVNVPAAVTEPELVAMVFFGSTSPQGAFNITSRYGVSVYAALSKSVRLECNILGVDIEPNVVTENGASINKGIIFVIDVENKGNVHLRPTGNIFITAEDGTRYNIPIVRDFPVYPSGHLNQRVFWKDGKIPSGKYRADIELFYGAIYKVDKKISKEIVFRVNGDGRVSLEKE